MKPKPHTLADHLSSSNVFGRLPPATLAELADLSVRRQLKKGNVLCFQGDLCRQVFYVESGTLRSVINSPDGRIYVVSTWEAGDEFWSHTLFDDEPMPSTLEAVKSTVVYQWQGEDALNMVLRSQAATCALLRRQTQLIRRRRENIYNLAFNPVASRLAKLVIEKFVNVENPTVQRDLTLEEMAAMVASSPEVICRTLYQFQSDGFLTVNRASITLHNRQALEDLVSRD